MSNLAEYFKKNRYQPKFQVGDRVTGLHKKARWVGTVANDTLINEDVGPELHVTLDLPLKIDGVFRSILVTGHKGVKKLVKID